MKRLLPVLCLVLSMTAIIAEESTVAVLEQGSNNVSVQSYFPAFPASKLITQYPQIQSISYESYGQTFGYVNVLGGIGTDFLIQPGETYEIYSGQELSLDLNSYQLSS